MMRPPSRALLTLLVLAPGCWGELASSALSEVNPIDDTSTSTGDESGGSTWISTVTTATTSATGGESEAGTDASDTASDSGSDTDSATSEADLTTTGEPVAPPAITDHNLDPETIQLPGAIRAQIWADADGVRMDLQDGTSVELTPAGADLFEGEIATASAIYNDDYHATFTPWRGDLEQGDLALGEAVVLPYTLDLPAGGSEVLFEVDYESGPGRVRALDVLPGSDVVELLTVAGNGTRCELRRRDKAGKLLDVVDVYPGADCDGLALEIDDDGALHLLVNIQSQGVWRWWLLEISEWGVPAKKIAHGETGEAAHALALSPIDGTLAICGSAPTVEPQDLTDAKVWIVQDGSTSSKAFDYPKNGWDHAFDEVARGCVFDAIDPDRLLLIGEVFGKHDWENEDVKRNRRFDVLYDIKTDLGDVRVAGPGGLATQSFAVDVAADPDGHIYVVGLVCDDACVAPEAQMWTLDAEGDLASTTSLGVHDSKALGPTRIRWNHAGDYLLIASGGLSGSKSAFTVRAFAPFKAEPLYTYVHQDAGLFHGASALASGPDGYVYAGGYGADWFAAFAIFFG